MKYSTLVAGAVLSLTCATVYADEPPQPPRTHVDTTVVGDSTMDKTATSDPESLDNNHRFVAGAPDILKVTKRLNLSAQQTSQVHDAIENADAGAAVLIKREHDLQQMIAATTPEDPMYAKLIVQQTADASLWDENRENLRREVLNLLTPAQRSRFEELQARS